MKNKIEVLLSHVVGLEDCFDSRPSGVAEQRHRSGLIRYAITPRLRGYCQHSSSELKDVERQLSEKLGSQRPADHAKDEEDAFRLLEGLQETIFHYQVCSCAGTLPTFNKGKGNR